MSSETKKRIITSLGLLTLLTGMYFYSYLMIVSLIIISIIIWIEFYALISKIVINNSIKHKLIRFFYKTISLLYLSLLVYLILSIESHYKDLKIYLLYTVLVAILSDIGGLVVGKIFKGKKLTKISPKKTVSGSIGSFIFSSSLIPLFYEKFIEYDLLILTIITLLISLITQLGDLFISYLKRKAKIKDTGNFLPGHGGVLDRLDGILFGVPTGIYALTLIY